MPQRKDNLKTVKEIKARQALQLDDVKDRYRQCVLELGHIVNAKGYSYAKSVADQILDEYRCTPPKKNEDATKWDSYCIINWAINQLFGRIEQMAGKKVLLGPEPLTLDEVKQDADNRRSKREYRLDPAEPRKRRSASKRGGKRS